MQESPRRLVRHGLFLKHKRKIVTLKLPAQIVPDPVVTATSASADDDEVEYSPSPLVPSDNDAPLTEDDGSEVDTEAVPAVVDLFDLPMSLGRAACLRCLKHLEVEPGFGCCFPPSHSKCTRCTRLKSKCEAVGSLSVVSFNLWIR